MGFDGWEEHVETSDESVHFEEIEAAEAEAGAAAPPALAASGAGTGCGGVVRPGVGVVECPSAALRAS